MSMVMRRMRDSTKVIMLATALAFVGLMVFQWGMDLTGRSSGGAGEIGRVDGVPVAYERYMAAYRNLYDRVQQNQDEPITSQQNAEIEEAAWNEVVTQILIQEELARRGIEVSDEEIRQAARFNPPPELRQEPIFQTDGQFDLQKYQQFLASSAADEYTLLQLEAYYRDVIPRGKLLRQVSSGIYVTDGELWQGWKDFNERVRVRYLSLEPDRLVPDSEVVIGDAEIQAYYREHQEDFGVPARARVKIVVLPKVPTAADSAAAIERASRIRQEIVAGADFGEVAARESSDPGSAASGGDLGTFSRGQMVAPFDEFVFSARPQELSEPILTTFGYHIIQVLDRRGDSAQARHVLVPVERTEDSELRLLARADSLEELSQNLSLDEAARTLGVQVTSLAITRDFAFATGAGQISEGSDWAFEEALAGDVSPVFENGQAFYALELEQLEPERIQAVEEARPSIEGLLRFERKKQKALEEGVRWAAEAREGTKTLDDLAEEHGLEVREAGPFSRSEFVPGLGRQNAAIGEAFGLSEGEVSEAVATDNDVFLLELVERVPADSAAWESQKEDQRFQLAAAFRDQTLQEWIEGLRENATIRDRREEVLRPADEADPLAGVGSGLY